MADIILDEDQRKNYHIYMYSGSPWSRTFQHCSGTVDSPVVENIQGYTCETIARYDNIDNGDIAFRLTTENGGITIDVNNNIYEQLNESSVTSLDKTKIIYYTTRLKDKTGKVLEKPEFNGKVYIDKTVKAGS